jgi:hypothetical protein
MRRPDDRPQRLWRRVPLLVVVAVAAGGAVIALDRPAYVEGEGSSAADAARSPRATCGPTRGRFRVGRWPGGCWRPYGRRSPFNRPLPARPRLAANSRAIVRRLLRFGSPQHLEIGTAGTPDDFAHPVAFSRPHDPRYRLRCRGRYGICPLDGRMVRVPARARPAAGRDAHLAVVDQRRRIEYDLWQVTAKPRGGGTLRFTYGGSTAFHGDGLRAGATAAGFGLMAGAIRAAELERGRIRHALFMTVLCDAGRAVYPAADVGRPCSAIGRPNAGAPPMGTRFRLAMSRREIAGLRVPRWTKAILRAMARYGMFVGDTGGSSWGLQLESGATYTAYGRPDPLAAFARRADLPRHRGRWVLGLPDAVDWRRLRVVAPCVTARRC